MKISIYILCYNESTLLKNTIEHYRNYLPSANIIIYDNESSDDSVNIALKLGCRVVSLNSNNEINDYKYLEIKNNCWKEINEGWIIIIDMDEWLCITEEDLLLEELKGTTILNTQGYNMIGDSENLNLDDIDLHSIVSCIEWNWESKKVCFNRNNISEINYGLGCHTINPIGNVKYSNYNYKIKHMEYLGLNFILDKFRKRFDRSHLMRSQGIACHYTDEKYKIMNNYINFTNDCFNIKSIL